MKSTFCMLITRSPTVSCASGHSTVSMYVYIRVMTFLQPHTYVLLQPEEYHKSYKKHSNCCSNAENLPEKRTLAVRYVASKIQPFSYEITGGF